MHNQHTRIEYRQKPGFFQRLGQSCSGIVVGLSMFLCSFIILYYNEGWYVETAVMLDEGLKEVVKLDHAAKIAFNGKLVHHYGYLETAEEVIDPVFDLHAKCVHLRRSVEMYQWVEYSEVKEYNEGDKIRKETTYKYSTEWKAERINSRNFDEEIGHKNPMEKPYDDITFTSSVVSIDGIRLSTNMINEIVWYKTLQALPSLKSGSRAILHKHYYFFGKDPYNPQVGDSRVFFDCAGAAQGSTFVPAESISVVAQLNVNTFGPYMTKNGKSIEFLYQGRKTAKEIFDSEHSSNSVRTWFLRAFGSILMFFGLSIMSRIIVTLFDWIPIVREIVTISVVFFNFSLASTLSLTTIAISWIRFRPLLASSLFAIACIPWYISRQRARSFLSR